MPQQHTEQPRPSGGGRPACPERASFGTLQYVLWTVWTVAVLATAYLAVRPKLLFGTPIDLLGLIIHCIVVGIIGLVAITMIEIHLEPWRFPDDDPPEQD
ncbi:MAG: hypothetical protein H0X37_26080 [Herpetosiphonaceae bacterium]|nr:hypothetical protein [Herpetosiphonaceae bacterium]